MKTTLFAKPLSLPVKTLLGTGLGLLAGWLLGERAQLLAPVSTAFVMLLRMSVLPYLTVSIIYGIGALSPQQLTLALRRSALFLLLFWVITLVVIYAVSALFMSSPPPLEYSSLELPAQMRVDSILRLFIPDNVFAALSQSVVPATVAFSVIFGVALSVQKDKAGVIDGLHVIMHSLTQVMSWMYRLSPYGLFAIMANLVATSSKEVLLDVQYYLVAWIIGTSLLGLWVLPRLTSLLTGIAYRKLLAELATPILLAFSTGALFVGLPGIIEAVKRLAIEKAPKNAEQTEEIADSLIPVAYNIPAAGTYFQILFILFAGTLFNVSLSVLQHLSLALMSMIGTWGHVSVSIPFLLDMYEIPIDAFSLFLATSPITNSFQAALSGIHLFGVGLLAVSSINNTIQLPLQKLVWFGGVTLLMLSVLAVGGSLIAPRDQELAQRTPVPYTPPMPVAQNIVEQPSSVEPALERIRRTGILRVGYATGIAPFVTVDENGALSGYDIQMARSLAKQLNAELEFVYFDYATISDAMRSNQFDIGMAGIALTSARLRQMSFSNPYIEVKVALVVRDHRRGAFASYKGLQRGKGLTIAVRRGTNFLDIVKQEYPEATILEVSGPEAMTEGDIADAFLWTEEEALPFVRHYPQFTVVVPEGSFNKLAYVFALPARDSDFLHLVNSWIELQRSTGYQRELYRRWFMGDS